MMHSCSRRNAAESRVLLPACLAVMVFWIVQNPAAAAVGFEQPGRAPAVVWNPTVPMHGISRFSPVTPLQMRAAMLYREREFSTFIRHSTVTSAGPFETAIVRPPLERRTEDRWFAFDKVQHLTFSFLWTLGTQYVVVNKGLTSERRGLPISITSSALVGVAKEVYDLRIGPTKYFSYRDLTVDGVGILLAVGVILL